MNTLCFVRRKGKVPIATADVTASSLRWHMKKVSSKIDRNNFQCFCGRTLEKFEHEILPGSTESTADPEDNSASKYWHQGKRLVRD